MFAHVLVPVDLTDRNERALELASHLAGSGEITLLHVIETLDLPFEELRDFYDRLHDRAQAAMDRMVERLAGRHGFRVQQRISYGPRLHEILACVEELPADLVVMSSRRLEPSDPPTTLATLSHQVAVLSRVPVLLVK